jgi:hypothetical protein
VPMMIFNRELDLRGDEVVFVMVSP